MDASTKDEPALYPLEVSVIVQAPAERTWAVATDWSRQHEWVMATTTRGMGPTGGHAAGEELHARTAVGPFGFLDSMVIETWDPPHRCGVVKTGRVVRGRAEFRVDAISPTTSRFTYHADVRMPPEPLGRLLWPAVSPAIRAGFRRSLDRLATLVEQ